MTEEKRLLALAQEAVTFYRKLDVMYVDQANHYRLLDAKIGNLLVDYMDSMGELGLFVEEMEP